MFLMLAVQDDQRNKEANSGKAGKVELDLDDAPFLQDEPEEKPAPVAKGAAKEEHLAAPELPSPPKRSLMERLKAQKKVLAISGLAAVLLIGAAVTVNMLLSGNATPPPEDAAPEEAPKDDTQKTIVIVPATPQEAPAPAGPKHMVHWDAFLVEVKDPEGEARIMEIKFSFPTDDDPVFIEMQNKETIMRDSVFYYLRNRSYDFLIDNKNIPDLKAGVVKIINDNIRNGELKESYIDFYRIR